MWGWMPNVWELASRDSCVKDSSGACKQLELLTKMKLPEHCGWVLNGIIWSESGVKVSYVQN